MSSKHNHMVRSHRSERRKASAFAGFRPALSPNRNKYANKTSLSFGLSAIRNLLARRRAKNMEAAHKEAAHKEAEHHD